MGFVELRIDRDDKAELEEALRAQQIPIHVRQMTHDSIDALMHVEQIIRYGVDVGGLAALGKALQAWLKARSDRTLQIKFRSGKIAELTAKGYSLDEATKWLETAVTLTLTEAGKKSKKKDTV